MAKLARKITQFTRDEIKQLFKAARRVLVRNEFYLLRAPSTGDFGKILIVLSRRVGNAPTRNKIRRQIKALFYENKIYERHFNWAVITKPSIKNLPYPELKELLLTAFNKK